MRKSCSLGFLNATDAADYLVRKGVPLREAHEIVGKPVFYCIENNKALEELTINEFKNISDKFSSNIYNSIDIEKCADDRRSAGGPSSSLVLEAVKNGFLYLSKIEK